MKKLYTPDHKRITTCNDFEIKFHDFLDFIKIKEVRLYNQFLQEVDFQVADMITFKEIFISFFSSWSFDKYAYNLSPSSIDVFFNSVSRTSQHYSEWFAYFNIYKFLNFPTLFIYDITLEHSEEMLLHELAKMNKVNEVMQTSYKKLEELENRGFIKKINNEITLTFKGRQVALS